MKYKDRIRVKRNYKQALLATVTTFTLGVSALGGAASAFAAENTKEVQKQSQSGFTIKNKSQLTEENNVGKINLSKIKEDLANQKKVFEENKNNLFIGAGLGIDDNNITSLEHAAIIQKEVAKKIATNIIATQPESIPKIEELRKTMSKDSKIGKVENIEDVIKELIIGWNKFTDRPLIKTIQLAAAKKFNLPYADMAKWKGDIGEYELHIDTIGIILEEMKNETQNFLKSKGIKELTVFRGVKSPTKMNENGVEVQQSSALSSFSFSEEDASSYATSSDPEKHPYLLVKNIPVDRILSLGVTGFGLMEHSEVVVLGGMYPQDEFFVLPGETGSDLKLLLEQEVKMLHKGDLDLIRELINDEAGKQLKEHSETIANQLDKIIKETPDLKPDNVRDKLYKLLIGEPLKLGDAIAHEIANGLCPFPSV
ncbi:hypothetical protein IIU_06725 [Bacillus cereus VD133]|uniref:Uncharacterized protein n=1 Tax=Bacillus cereus VD133 TaxID=1053233 RepID=A0A9W5PJT1_BACCE|nr:hypothetical protein [Bacillus cereus]EOO24463.1 hypothetical protein IIU_06725 [Bacillus cereus VD133]